MRAAGPTVVEIPAVMTHDLRRRVLRDGDPAAEVRFPHDDDPGALHLGVVDAGELVAVATACPVPTPWREGRRAAQLRGMAVEPARQGRGVGRLLLDAAVARLVTAGIEVLWANARDSALGFYETYGMSVVGEGFLTADTGLPHHVVLLDLQSD